ncbi:histidine kinase [Pedobacter sp. JY14-1]|uniref:sensor histidine kinase n=1 Tax=Pedobacter sp. JY14-1 TaxID=3034151 RepID=UPI0023E14667|nr:histidine kinase [Pedobacter sp. JY14-1]
MNLKDLSRIEFWIATGLYGFAMLLLITNSGDRTPTHTEYLMDGAGLKYSYISNYLIPELFRFSILYFTFLALNFCIAPSLFDANSRLFSAIVIFVLFLGIGLTTSILNTYSQAYRFSDFSTNDEAYSHFFLKGFTYAAWLISVVMIYIVIKKMIFYFREHQANEYDPASRMKLETVFGAAVWFVGLLLLLATSSPFEVMVCWTLVISASVFLVILSIYYLIPQALEAGKTFRNYFGKFILITLTCCIPLALVALLFSSRGEVAAVVIAFHIPVQLTISAPLSWYIYRRRNETNAQLMSLKTELGRSDASLSFLRSQINPHFLFNALNTLYGTALQESAERTGEGIQMLGDMMRFMLQENVQEKISLTRDIDYLNNYIALQKLRTFRSTSIVIETSIEDRPNSYQIAPMLLIPFVENAFKHGISLQQPSHIKITLQMKDDTLYFDVHNSTHQKTGHDPEKGKSGIGLTNTRQRLQHLYPKSHELIIRESATEFFVHLTLKIGKNS